MTESDWISRLINSGEMTEIDVQKWSRLRDKVIRCTRCELHKQCSHRVFGVGNPKAKVLFVGEAPGAKEDLMNEPFVGPSGMYLRKKMQEVGFKRGDVYITNTVRCRPPGNREPSAAEVGECMLYLIEQLDLIQPKVVVAVGSTALKTLCPHSRQKIGGCRGDVLSGYGYAVIPIWHPAFIIRGRSELREKEFFKDLRKVYRKAFGDRDADTSE